MATHRCFLSVTNSSDGSLKDTMRLQLTVAGDQVSGRMDWLPQEKDHMTGTLQGTIARDTISAWYTYSSEGMTNTEERLLLLGRDRVTLLNGEMEERDDKWMIKDRRTASEGMHVPEVECP